MDKFYSIKNLSERKIKKKREKEQKYKIRFKNRKEKFMQQE